MGRHSKRDTGQFDTELLKLALAALPDQPACVQRMTLRQIEDRALRRSIEGKEEEAEALYAFVSSILPGSFSHARDTASLNRPVAEAALPRQAAAACSPGTGQPPRRASKAARACRAGRRDGSGAVTQLAGAFQTPCRPRGDSADDGQARQGPAPP